MGDLLMALNHGKWGFYGSVWVLTIQNRDFVGFEPCKSGDLIGFKRSNVIYWDKNGIIRWNIPDGWKLCV
jgi:hypothetical protein